MSGVPAVSYASGKPSGRRSAASSSCESWASLVAKWAPRRHATRSRSPVRPAFPGLRDTAPSRVARGRVSIPDLRSQEAQEEAVLALERDIKAGSTHVSDDSRIRTICRWLKWWHVEPFPPTVASVKALAATLKAGGTNPPMCISQSTEGSAKDEVMRLVPCSGMIFEIIRSHASEDWADPCVRDLYPWSC